MVVGSSPTRSIVNILEDYPSPAEGNGLENRQTCKSVLGFESLILLISSNYNVWLGDLNIGSVAQLVEQWIEAPCVGGSIPSRAIYIFWKGSEEAKRGGL